MNNYELAQLLLDNGADVNAQSEDGSTSLHWATDNIAKLLIKNKSDVNAQDAYGQTPLHFTTCFKRDTVFKILLENGADPFIKNIDGKIPLDFCESEEIRSLLEKYMEDYKQISPTPSIDNNDLLYFAFDNNLIEVKKCVYSGNYDINVQDDKGYTPLIYAITNHNLNMVRFLVKNGADINLCNNKGQSPLKIAYLYNSEKIAEYLLEKGATDKTLEEKKIIMMIQ